MSGLELATTLVPIQSGLTLPDFILVGPEFRCVCFCQHVLEPLLNKNLSMNTLGHTIDCPITLCPHDNPLKLRSLNLHLAMW